MRIPRIYTSQPLGPQQLIELDEKTSHYIARVLRLKTGAALILFNGQGGQYPATIDSLTKKSVSVSLGEQDPIERESPLNIHLGIAISKGDRMDWVIQKSTELGVTEITPLTSERTEVKLSGERLTKKINHWQQIAISACEQSGRNRVPTIHALSSAAQWSQQVVADRKLTLHPATDNNAVNTNNEVQSAALLIGPEGGFATAEVEFALQKGFAAHTVGPRILRTETAPLVAIALMQQCWGDFSL